MTSNRKVWVGVCLGAAIGFAGVVGYGVSHGARLGTPAEAQQGRETEPLPTAADVAHTYRVQLGEAPVRGPADAKVTIVEFSDFECVFCGRAFEVVRKIQQKFGNDVRLVYKQNPISMLHPHAEQAAAASIAAGKQGKFWEMHDKLFEANRTHQREALDPTHIQAMVRSLHLDPKRFEEDLKSPDIQDIIRSDQAQAAQVGAEGTPQFFVNGANIPGYKPYEYFERVVELKLKEADDLVARGTPRASLYEELMRTAQTSLPRAQAQEAPPAPSVVRHIAPSPGSPSIGAKRPKVVIVEWSDFQCPYCRQAEPTLKELLRAYKDDVRLVWRNQPLPATMHPAALPAATAALAAHRQGKFWQMHDLMYEHQSELNEANYEAWAKAIGLNVPRWKKDREAAATQAEIAKDQADGDAVGASGTPAFFVNGKFLSGAMPIEMFRTLIDQQLVRANELLKAGTSADQIPDVLMEENVKAAGSAQADADKPMQIEVAGSPVRGKADAPVTVVVMADFQCPACGQAERTTLAEMRSKYGEKLRFVWKNFPLPNHPQARPAAEAAMAAFEQGNDKFWAYHDKLFENQRELGPELYERTAREVGLDLERFHASVAQHQGAARLDQDLALGQTVGLEGTPTFYINGRKLLGGDPTKFARLVDQALSSPVANK